MAWREIRQINLDRNLILAIKHNNAPLVVSLLKAGASANTRDVPSDTRPFWQIMRDTMQRRKRTLDTASPPALLVALQVTRSVQPIDGYKDEVTVDTTPIVKALLDQGADIHIRHEDDRIWPAQRGDTPLMVAARNGFVGTVRLLLDKGAEINANNRGHTALMEAIRWGSEEDRDNEAVCILLLQRGANPEIRRDGDGFTPLMSAVYGHHEFAVRLLLNWQVDVNNGWKEGRTTALDCAYYHLPSFVPILKKAGARKCKGECEMER